MGLIQKMNNKTNKMLRKLIKKKLNFLFPDSQKGASLYFSILIIGILLSMALGLSTLAFIQIRVIRGIGHSVKAFYAANTGIERVFFDERQGIDIITVCPPASPCEGWLDVIGEDPKYRVIVLSANHPDCPAYNYCMESIGFYRGIRRAIRVIR